MCLLRRPGPLGNPVRGCALVRRELRETRRHSAVTGGFLPCFKISAKAFQSPAIRTRIRKTQVAPAAVFLKGPGSALLGLVLGGNGSTAVLPCDASPHVCGARQVGCKPGGKRRNPRAPSAVLQPASSRRREGLRSFPPWSTSSSLDFFVLSIPFQFCVMGLSQATRAFLKCRPLGRAPCAVREQGQGAGPSPRPLREDFSFRALNHFPNCRVSGDLQSQAGGAGLAEGLVWTWLQWCLNPKGAL